MKRLVKSFLAMAFVLLGVAGAILRSARNGDANSLRASGKSGTVMGKWSIKRSVITILVFLILLGAGGFFVAASGIVPVKASAGHWAITEWFLSFSMSRSVATHSIGIKAPDLNDPQLVLLGAGHFETGCVPCHGSPSRPRSPIALAMTPVPPKLSIAISEWEPEELFYIVKHGVKMTGMPAWPALERDDEVWAVTAFLLELPEMDAAKYRQLVYGSTTAELVGLPSVSALQDSPAPLAAARCARCHGADGNGRGEGAFPALAGQRPQYLEESLLAYATGERHSGIMQPFATALTPDEIRELSLYYAALAPRQPQDLGDQPELVAGGEAIALHGLPAGGLPACSGCHSPEGEAKNAIYPILAGQNVDYLYQQLQLFREENRGGTAYAHLMRHVAARLTDEQMQGVAHYYAYQRRRHDSRESRQ